MGEQLINCGKYKGELTYRQIYDQDQDYCQWCL